jgi:hypothetical protein
MWAYHHMHPAHHKTKGWEVMSTVQPDLPRFVKGVEYFSLTACLKHFRQEVEKGTGAQIQTIEINAALLLSDVCTFIGLSDEKRREVLGKSAAAFVSSVEDEPIKPNDTKH